jgi:hypothetical protein
MARTEQVALSVDDNENPAPASANQYTAQEVADLDREENGDLFRGIDEIHSSGAVSFHVYCLLPPENEGFCRDYPAASFSLEAVQRDYGPGTYRIRVKGPGGKFIPGGGTQKIRAAIVRPPSEADEFQKRESEERTRRETREAEERKDARDLRSLLISTLAPLVGNLLIPKQTSVTELIAGLASLKSLQPEPKKEPDQIEQLAKVMALANKMKGGGGWEDILKEGLGILKPAIEAQAQAAKIAPPSIPSPVPVTPSITVNGSAPALAGPSAESTASASDPLASQPPNAEGDTMLSLARYLPWLRTVVGSNVMQAAKGGDPGLYAEVFLDNLPEGLSAATVAAMLMRPDWFQLLCQLDARAQHYAGWFAKFRESCFEILTPPAPTPAPPADPPGSSMDDDGDQGEQRIK